MTQRFFRDAGFLAAVEAVSRVKGVVLLPLLTYQLGAAGYGIWTQVSVLVSVVLPVLFLGTDSAALRFLPGTDSGKRRAVFSAWALSVSAPALLCGLLLAVGADWVAPAFFGRADVFASYVRLAGLALVAAVLLNVVKSWFRIVNDAKYVGAVTLVQTVTSLAAAVAVLVMHDGAFRLVLYTIIGDLGLMVWLALTVLRRGGWGRPARGHVGALVRFGLPLFPSAYAMLGLNAMDRLFLVHYGGLDVVGMYALGYSFGYLAIQLLVNPVWIMFPGAAAELHNRGDADGVVRLFEQSVAAACLLGFPALVGSAVLSRDVVAALAPPQFTRAAPVVPIVLAAYLAHMLASYCEVRLYLLQKQYVSTVSTLVAVGINLVLNIVLIPRYSMVGAAVATLVGFVAQLAVAAGVAHRLKALSWPRRVVIDATVASLLMGAVVLALSKTVLTGSPRVALPVLSAAGAVLYVALLTARDRSHVRAVRLLVTRRRAVPQGVDAPLPPA